MPRYFILFDVMVNGIVSLISLSDLSLLASRNAIYFYVLILYPATLANSLMSSNSFLVAPLGFSWYSIMSSANRVLLLPFPIWIPFISSLIAVARTSQTMLNSNGKNGHLCLFPDLSGILSAFAIENDVNSGSVVYDLYYVGVASL